MQAIVVGAVLTTLTAFGINIQPLLAVGSISTGGWALVGIGGHALLANFSMSTSGWAAAAHAGHTSLLTGACVVRLGQQV